MVPSFGPPLLPPFQGSWTGGRSPGGPDRCNVPNTTPSGASTERPQDVLTYNTVIHNRLLTDCGWIGSSGDDGPAPRTKPEDAPTKQCGRGLRQTASTVDDGCSREPRRGRKLPGREEDPRRVRPTPRRVVGVSSPAGPACRSHVLTSGPGVSLARPHKRVRRVASASSRRAACRSRHRGERTRDGESACRWRWVGRAP